MSSLAESARARGNNPLSFDKSAELIERNAQWMAGGVNSNFRLNISPTPLVFERGEGPWLYDADGNKLIDYYLGMGPMILGHKPQALVDAVKQEIEKGFLFAGQTTVEAEAARLVCELVPSAERMRFGCSGSEVDQAAIRLARAATGRKKIIKFEGHYHGWFDNVLWSTAPALNAAGPENAPVPVAGSKGQLTETADALVVLPWNNLDLVVERLAQGDIAGVIMEAAMCNAGAVHPAPGYLEGVREACTRYGTILIFDEVITGFRLAPGGAQERFGVTPDLSTFGKAIANGFPVAAIVGRADLMEMFATGGVVHGGTYNAQPIAMAATVATLMSLKPSLYATLEERGGRLMRGMGEIFARAGVLAQVAGFPQVFHVALGLDVPARNYRDLARMDRPAYVALTTALLHRGVRALERGAWFLSIEHSDAVIDDTLLAVEDSVRELKAKGVLPTGDFRK
ncbi:aspartate aminotransferase family protein [Microvirga lotononidis]|uniref:Glutamate-1-semialdehyde aminotransferase n=1 Tax=Microvirga lotononidis TaxID=864069 RepID=I4Z173_9HYPH|nr:aspartate aminotransferase family protein [Microvirga lotononidis]EIM29965.1 glutamate-1-semialdehyde aminotransferase [Microvirga lotononidis]WQO31974.1 aspartate aminotransferase family protein [Microvirga lotononidis]